MKVSDPSAFQTSPVPETENSSRNYPSALTPTASLHLPAWLAQTIQRYFPYCSQIGRDSRYLGPPIGFIHQDIQPFIRFS